MFADNLQLLLRVEKVMPQHVLALRVYGSREEHARRKIRRLMNRVIRPTLDDVIKYAYALDVDASDLAFGTDGVFNPYVEVEDHFQANISLFDQKHTTHEMACFLYPNKRVVDVNDGRKLRRLVQGVTRPRMDDIVNLATGLGISPGKLSFGVL